MDVELLYNRSGSGRVRILYSRIKLPCSSRSFQEYIVGLHIYKVYSNVLCFGLKINDCIRLLTKFSVNSFIKQTFVNRSLKGKAIFL